MVFFYLAGCALALVYLPWWSLGVVCTIGGLLFVKPLWQDLAIGLLLGGLLWTGLSFYMSAQNQHILYHRFVEGAILPLNPLLLTAILGAFHSLLGSIFGYMLGRWRSKS